MLNKINLMHEKDNFLCTRIKNIHSAIMNPLMLIGGSLLGIENFIDNNELEKSQEKYLIQQINIIKNNITFISENINALDISSTPSLPVKTLLSNIETLLNSEITKNNVKLTMFIPETYFLVDLQNGYIPFIISEILINLINVGNKKINIIAKISEQTLCLELPTKQKLTQNTENILKNYVIACNNVNFYSSNNTYRLEITK